MAVEIVPAAKKMKSADTNGWVLLLSDCPEFKNEMKILQNFFLKFNYRVWCEENLKDYESLVYLAHTFMQKQKEQSDTIVIFFGNGSYKNIYINDVSVSYVDLCRMFSRTSTSETTATAEAMPSTILLTQVHFKEKGEKVYDYEIDNDDPLDVQHLKVINYSNNIITTTTTAATTTPKKPWRKNDDCSLLTRALTSILSEDPRIDLVQFTQRVVNMNKDYFSELDCSIDCFFRKVTNFYIFNKLDNGCVFLLNNIPQFENEAKKLEELFIKFNYRVWRYSKLNSYEDLITEVDNFKHTNSDIICVLFGHGFDDSFFIDEHLTTSVSSFELCRLFSRHVDSPTVLLKEVYELSGKDKPKTETDVVGDWDYREWGYGVPSNTFELKLLMHNCIKHPKTQQRLIEKRSVLTEFLSAKLQQGQSLSFNDFSNQLNENMIKQSTIVCEFDLYSKKYNCSKNFYFNKNKN